MCEKFQEADKPCNLRGCCESIEDLTEFLYNFILVWLTYRSFLKEIGRDPFTIGICFQKQFIKMCGWIAVISASKRTALSYKIIDTLNICSAWACCLVQGRSKQTVVVAVMVPAGLLERAKMSRDRCEGSLEDLARASLGK